MYNLLLLLLLKWLIDTFFTFIIFINGLFYECFNIIFMRNIKSYLKKVNYFLLFYKFFLIIFLKPMLLEHLLIFPFKIKWYFNTISVKY